MRAILYLVCLWLLLPCLVQTSYGMTLQELKKIVRTSDDLQVVKRIAAQQDQNALELLFEFCGMRSVRLHVQIAEIFSDLPGAEAYVRAKVAALPILHENNRERTDLLHQLAHIHKRWCLNILGEMVEKMEEPTTQLSDYEFKQMMDMGQYGNSNAKLAIHAMGNMRLANFPLNYNPFSYHRLDMEAIRTWWLEHKNEPDSYFFDGTIDYANPPPFSRRPTPAMVPGTLPTNVPPDPNPKPKAKPDMIARSEPEENTILLPVMVVGAVLLLCIVFLLWRSQQGEGQKLDRNS